MSSNDSVMRSDSYNDRQLAKAEGLLRRGQLLRLFDHSGNPSAFITCGDLSAAPCRIAVEVAQRLIDDGIVSHSTRGWNYDDYVLVAPPK